jgi:DNA repair protein RecN (Recombination protein N)
MLDADARVEEIARMLGGVDITAITRQHAQEMLGGFNDQVQKVKRDDA